MTTSTHASTVYGIEIRADFDQAASKIEFRVLGDDDWQATVYQVADAGHAPDRALQMVSDWADAQA